MLHCCPLPPARQPTTSHARGTAAKGGEKRGGEKRDGLLDSIQDNRSQMRRTSILYDGRFIEVRAGLNGASEETVTSMDGTTTYVFESVRWTKQD